MRRKGRDESWVHATMVMTLGFSGLRYGWANGESLDVLLTPYIMYYGRRSLGNNGQDGQVIWIVMSVSDSIILDGWYGGFSSRSVAGQRRGPMPALPRHAASRGRRSTR